MAGVEIYMKPRPISSVHGHSNYLLFEWPSNFKYGPFFAEYGTIPSDATEVYTARSPVLSTSLSTLFNDVIPDLDTEVPDPTKVGHSAWPALLQLAIAKTYSAFEFRIECENHIVQLSEGDRAPAPPPLSMRTPSLSPEWYAAVLSVGDRGHVELRGDKQDIELELFVWMYMQQTVDTYTHIWKGFRREMYQLIHPIAPVHLPSGHTDNPGLFSFLGRKALVAASALTSIFNTETSVDDGCIPQLSPSSSNGSSATDWTDWTDWTSSSHADDLDEDANMSSLYRLFRRRNLGIVSESVDSTGIPFTD